MLRRKFVKKSLLRASGTYLLTPAFIPAQRKAEDKLSFDLVYDFVVNCHSNLEKVKELYKREPRLIFSSYDWGNGDFENGIEAAGHMGEKGIAEFLISKVQE